MKYKEERREKQGRVPCVVFKVSDFEKVERETRGNRQIQIRSMDRDR